MQSRTSPVGRRAALLGTPGRPEKGRRLALAPDPLGGSRRTGPSRRTAFRQSTGTDWVADLRQAGARPRTDSPVLQGASSHWQNGTIPPPQSQLRQRVNECDKIA